MTIEITKSADLVEIRKSAEELLINAENAKNLEDRKAYEDALEQTVTYYKAVSKAQAYEAAKSSPDPMRWAINTFSYPTIKVTIATDDAKNKFRRIDDTESAIDLRDLHAKLDGIGVDKNWIHIAEKLNYYLTVRSAKRVGATVNSDAFVMSDIAKKMDMGKDPCSNTNMLKTLQSVITAMLGEGCKATSHDVNYLIDVYSNDVKKSKTSVSAANHKTLVGYLKKVCYRILNNRTGYDVEQREIKENKK